MSSCIRKGAGLTVAALALAGLVVGMVMGHEGRPVGDYRFIVGWQNEPAYEGAMNAVSVRVNRVVVAAAGSHGGDGHQHQGSHGSGLREAAAAMSVDLETYLDSVSGVNLRIVADGFVFAPEKVNLAHSAGEGHAHVYVDGVKVGRVYTPWFHLDRLEPGRRELRVELNANSHEPYGWNGRAVEAVAYVTVPEPGDGAMQHDDDGIVAAGPMAVDFRLEADPLGGANLFVTEVSGFVFAPERGGGEHVDGEGHAHVYVNGVKAGRLYGAAFHLGAMAEGLNEVRVSLNANSHVPYIWDGLPVEAAASIDIAPGMGGAGYGAAPGDPHNGDGHSHNGDGHSSAAPAAPKVLGRLPAQHAEEVAPVEGLEGALQVEVRHSASGAARVVELAAVFGDPGHYVAGLIPTAAGVYEFRVFGEIDGMAIDETFASQGGGGGFDDIRSSAELQFPETLPELREVEAGVRGAIATAQQAQDAALAAQQTGGDGLAMAALVVGIAGVVLGAGGLVVAWRARRAM